MQHCIPKNEKGAVLSDCDNDGSDMDFEGEIRHFPVRLSNACAELMQIDNERNKLIGDDNFPTTQPPIDIEELRTSTHQRVQPEEPRTSTHQKVYSQKKQEHLLTRGSSQRNQGPRCRWSKIKTECSNDLSGLPQLIPNHSVYSPNTADCVKQSCPNPIDVFLLMYPPTLRELTAKMSNLYSTQTKNKQLYLSMDELLTFYGIPITCGYSSVPRRHMYWSFDVHSKGISVAIQRNLFDEIMASAPVVDNTKITDEPFFKVRPIFSGLSLSYKIISGIPVSG